MVFIIVIAVALWYWTLCQGRLTVRAYVYLGVLSRTGSQDIANTEALSLGFMAATDYAPDAKAFVHAYFNGRQLRMIAAARRAGFRG